jgi:3D (Asp-Asp-Asp) domain-containing protein
MLVVKNAEQLQREDEAAKNAKIEAEREATQPRIVDNLAAHVHKCWTTAKSHKVDIADRLTNCLRRRKGEYSPQKLSDIRKQGGSEIYMNLTGTKVHAAKAWLSDLFASSNDRPFHIEATPVPELPPEIAQNMISIAIQNAMMTAGSQQEVMAMTEQVLKQHEERIKSEINEEAEARMEKMAEHIEDMMVEGDFRGEFDAFLDDLVTYPFAILKGPIYRKQKRVKWVQDKQTGKHVAKMEDKLVRKFRRVSPFDFYPSPSTTNIGDHWHIEHVRFTPSTLTSMRGSKGYNSQNIALALNDHRLGLRQWVFEDSERERLEGKRNFNHHQYENIDGLEFTGWIQGKQLIEWGIEQQINDPYEEYPVTVVVVGNYTIKASVNPDPNGKPGYYKATFRSLPNSFCGEALAEIIEDIQDAANATMRALINNMAIGAQPQIAIDLAQIPQGANITSIHPGKIWQFNSKGVNGAGQSKPGINFFSPDIKANELLTVYEKFERYADDKSGIPAYAYGSDQAAGAGKTASGLSMLMNAASKSMKEVVRAVDIHVIEPLVSNLYTSAMIDPDVPEDIKGDAQVKARGSDALMHKEATAMRQAEFLATTNNPTDMQIIGLEGRRVLLDSAAKAADLPSDRFVPTEDELRQKLMQEMAAVQQQAAAQGQVPQ